MTKKNVTNQAMDIAKLVDYKSFLEKKLPELTKQLSEDKMLYKIKVAIISDFAELIRQTIKSHKKTNFARSHRFKPVQLPARPHLYWFLRRYQNRIIDFSIIGFTVATFLILIIKNWR